MATLPDSKCPGPKPSTTEICFAGLCDSVPPAKNSSAVVAVDETPLSENVDNFVGDDAGFGFKILASSMDLRRKRGRDFGVNSLVSAADETRSGTNGILICVLLLKNHDK